MAGLFLLLAIGLFAGSKIVYAAKEPVVIEVIRNQGTIEEALQAAKAVLLENKFVTTNGIQQSSFTATRTTGSKADYYVADVQASKTETGVKISITFVKVGTGLMNLKRDSRSGQKSTGRE